MHPIRHLTPLAIAAIVAIASPSAQADSITDWNLKSSQFIADARIGTPPAIRTMAIVQTAAAEALATAPASAAGAAEAAIAAAHCTALPRLLPAVAPAIHTHCQAALATLPDHAGKPAALQAGEAAAQAVLARRAQDGAAAAEQYRPHAAPGAYVPTAGAAVPQWARRLPWLLASPAQFRPAMPPALNTEAWAREYNEVKSLGQRASRTRSAEQTEVAKFWEYSLPAIYFGVVQSVATQPGRSLADNARLYAAVAQAMDDSLIAVWDAKYHYGFWRPVTAIRNGDLDGNAATERDAGWQSFIEAPMHPEYPSGHSILAAAVAEVLKAELAGRPTPTLATMSPSANGAVRRWADLDSFVQEVSDARIWAGIHFRSATNVGMDMGRRIGALAAQRLLPQH